MMPTRKYTLFCALLMACSILSLSQAALAQNPAAAVAVDAASSRKPINPNIYGTAFASTADLTTLNIPLNRSGGNATSCYNWQINAANRGFDWYFESIGESSSVAGELGDTFISNTKASGAQAMLTIPMVGWVAKLGPGRSILPSFSQAKYGAQTGSDPYLPDAGNGVLASTGQNVSGNDPNDANVPSDSTFQNGWIQHLVQTWGSGSNGGLKYYIMDNEPSLWHGTHRDVHPTGATMSEISTKIIDYASKVKTNDPSALVVGPEEWGWTGYFYSGDDQQYASVHGWGGPFPDRSNNGGWDYLPWVLNQLHQHDAASGGRSLDVFSVHYYPQSGEFSNDTSTNMELTRNRSTRSLWDPNYVDTSWINDKVELIPRLKNWVATYYPGLQTAITEYNWGAEGDMNGATTQADIWGIFGREGLDMATRWTTPASSTPTYLAMKLYRNYDGNKSTFGDTSVSASVANPDNVSAFAAQRTTDGALTVIVINKYLTGTTPVTVGIANFIGTGTAQVWQLANNAISHLANTTVTGNSLSFTAPAKSVTLFVLPQASTPPVVTLQPVDLSVIAGSSAGFIAAATGIPIPTVQWQVSTDGGSSFSDIPGATLPILSFVTTASDNGKRFRAVFSNVAGTAPTSAATLTVATSPVITTQPASVTVVAGTAASFTAAASGTPAPTVKWQVSTDGGASFSDIPGANAGTYTFTTAASDNGKQYRAVFSNSAGIATTSAAILTVTPAAGPLHTFNGVGWHLISSPFTISQTFASLSVPAFAYDPVAQNYVVTPTPPADTVHIGQGYWTYVRGLSLDITGPGTPAASSQPFSISLGHGWNLVGNPFTAPVTLSTISVKDSTGASVSYPTAIASHTVSVLFIYSSTTQSYQLLAAGTDSLNPWDGAWIYCKQSGTRLVFTPPTAR